MPTPVPVTPSDHVRKLLEDESLGVSGAVTGVRLSTGMMTEDPDTQIVCYDSAGELPNPKWLLDYPYVQVMSRGTKNDYSIGFNLLRQVYDVLLGIDAQSMTNGDRIDGITVITTPAFIGRDDKMRPMFSANFRLILEPAPSSLTSRQPL